MSPSLDAARRQVEAQMVDVCAITRGTDHTDDAFDETTLALAAPGPGTTVYAGPCLVTAISERASRYAGAPAEIATHRVAIPLSADLPRVGDTLVLTTTGDVSLLNQATDVVAVEGGTNLVYRPLRIVQRVAAEPTMEG